MNLFELYAKIALDTDDYEDGLDEASKTTSGFGDKLKNGLANAAKVGAAAISAASVAVTAFAKSSVDAGMQFDSSMSQVAATMGTTVDEIQELRDFAMEMGAKTAFSATEAADALNYMALAGYDAEQSMQALPNVLNLAAAGGIDLAYASDMVTDAQSALGLSMEESAELVDKMAKASSKSNTSVAQLGEAILTIGGTAKNLAGGTTELSTALGILADNGIKGAEGGTHLRNVILSLTSPTDAAAAAIDSLGLQVYDADGNMRPLNETLGDLQNSLSSMAQEEQTNLISTIFNKTDISSVNALLANTGDRWDELTGYINDASGAAYAMAETQLDNLSGDITLFKSALEGAKIVVSDQLTPTLRKFVKFGSNAISTLSDAFQEGGLSGAMDALGTILSDGLSMVFDAIPEVISAGSQLLGALIEGIINNKDIIISAAFSVIETISSSILGMLPDILSLGLDLLVSLAMGIAEAVPELVPTIVDVILKIVEVLTNPEILSNLIDAAIAIILALAEGLIAALPNLIERIPLIIDNIITAITNTETLKKLVESGIQLIVQLGMGIVQAIPQLLSNIPEIIRSFVRGFGEYFKYIFDIGKSLLTSIKDGFMEKVESAKNWGKDLIDNFIGGIKQKWENLKNTVSNIAQSIKDFLGFSEPKKGPLSNFHTYAPDMMDLFAKGIRDNEKTVTDQIEKSFNFGQRTIDVGFETGTYSVNKAASVATGGIGTVNITVNGANYSNEKSLAEAIAEELQNMMEREGAVYA